MGGGSWFRSQGQGPEVDGTLPLTALDLPDQRLQRSEEGSYVRLIDSFITQTLDSRITMSNGRKDDGFCGSAGLAPAERDFVSDNVLARIHLKHPDDFSIEMI